jgi:nicotinamidase-related amidase
MRALSSARKRSTDLHGSAPDSCPVALLLIDVINEFSFREGERLARRALPAARAIAELKQRATRAGVPAIYVNDNFGRWRSDFGAVVAQCGRAGSRGRGVVELLPPEPHDYFVLKPKHSGFHETPLSILLQHLGTRSVILVGFTTESCVAFTAHDAYLRDYTLVIPRDGTASADARRKRTALSHLGASLKAHTPLCSEITFAGRGARAKLGLVQVGR